MSILVLPEVLSSFSCPVVAIERGRGSAIESVIDHIENLPPEDFGLKHGRLFGVDVEIGTQKVGKALYLPHADESSGDQPLICIEVGNVGTGSSDPVKAGDNDPLTILEWYTTFHPSPRLPNKSVTRESFVQEMSLLDGSVSTAVRLPREL